MATYPGKDIEREASCASCAACGQTTLAPAEAAAAAWEGPAARIVAVEPESPADDAGFTPGCYLTTVDGEPLRDIIDWRWLAADDVICVGYIDLDGEAGEVVRRMVDDMYRATGAFDWNAYMELAEADGQDMEEQMGE